MDFFFGLNEFSLGGETDEQELTAEECVTRTVEGEFCGGVQEGLG